MLYAITMLEALDKRNLITPLLLQHESPRVRQRALMALAVDAVPHRPRNGRRRIERMVQDADVDVRAAALRALAVLSHEDASALMRRHLDDPEPRVAVAAADGARQQRRSGRRRGGGDGAAAADWRRSATPRRRAASECAAALAHIHNPQFRSLLVPLLYDARHARRAEAIRSARVMGATDGLFLPGLMSLLGHRALKADARDTLVGYGRDHRRRARSRAARPPRAHLAAPAHSQRRWR